MKKSQSRPKLFQVIRKGVIFELQSETEGGYTINVPSLPGCISYGDTFEEAMDLIKEEMSVWLDSAKEEGVKIPEQFASLRLADI